MVLFQAMSNLIHVHALREAQGGGIAALEIDAVHFARTDFEAAAIHKHHHTGNNQRPGKREGDLPDTEEVYVRQAAEDMHHAERFHPALGHEPVKDDAGYEYA